MARAWGAVLLLMMAIATATCSRAVHSPTISLPRSQQTAVQRSPLNLRLRGGCSAAPSGEPVEGTDGGVIKEVLEPGAGGEGPVSGDDVSVHYTGTLLEDGSKFDSSRDRNAPFTFKLGQGKVIKGWDVGVATMTRGEKARFTIRSDYAYGPTGSGDKIPANATLVFEVELLRWNEKEVTLDGGVTLKPLDKKGTGWRHPDKNDEVFVQYTGKLTTGETFVESAGFELVKLSSTSSPLPPGVEKAICKEMKKGSNAVITCAPEYAFGEVGGAGGKVAPKATVVYTVELKDWNAIYDVSKDGGIMVKCLGQLDTYGPLCDDASQVKLTLEGKLMPSGETIVGPSDLQVTVGDGALPEGLERGLEKIKKGQHAVIDLASKYAYGEAGSTDPPVPPNSNLQYEITVTEVVPTYQLQLSDKLQAAEKRKDQGNVFFKASDTTQALAKYDKAFKLIQYEQGEGDEAERVKDLKSVIHVNKAACYDKEGRAEDVMSECNKALDLKANNVKALFRRGKAYLAQNKLDEAMTDMKQLLVFEPNSAAAQTQIAAIKSKQKVQDSKDKAVFSKMFSKTSAPPKKPAAAAAGAGEGGGAAAPKVEEEAPIELGDDTRVA